MMIPSGVQLISELTEALFSAEYRRIEQSVKDLDRQNREIKGHTRHGFMYGGTVFVPKDAPHLRERGGYPSLAFELNQRGNFLVKDQNLIDTDKKMVEQLSYLLLKDCQTLQDVRDALPESMVSLSPELTKLMRLREEAYIIRDNERAFRQFQTLSEKIDFYTATRMIY